MNIDLPGYDPRRDAEGCKFDNEAASTACEFFGECLQHVKGKLAGEPFVLEPWQAAIIANLFGWKRADGTRRYREGFVYVPRKNGKSLLASGICNYMLFCDGEPGAEIYAAAAERDQAALVFNVSKHQVLREPTLSSVAKVYQKSITIEDTASSFKALSADASTKHGYNAHCVIVDELHAQKNRELVDVLETSTASRKQPLVLHITTADFVRESIFNEKLDYARKVRDGIIRDASFLPVIYEASRDDDWTDPDVWKKANPNFGISVSEEYLRRECQRAQDSPTYENTFKRLHLNIQTEQDIRWLQMERWDSCDGSVNYTELMGRTCYGGLDLSSTSDVTALALVFPGEDGIYDILPFFWIPEEGAAKRERRDRVPYQTWAAQGFLTLTPGNVVDYSMIRQKVNEIGGIYRIAEIAVDPWNAQQITTELAGDGLEMVVFQNSYANMNAPTKELEKLVISGNVRHGGHPVLRWMASNVTVDIDGAGNLKPSKKRSTEKIDGIVAVIMAFGRVIVGAGGPSVYETRGLIEL
jgi:phage terminase large subunit-like protein